MMRDVVIVEGVRTPFNPFGGLLRDIPSIELGACVMKEIMKRSGAPSLPSKLKKPAHFGQAS